MRINPAQGSHLAILIHWLQKTTGDVLELGIGFASTPVLHEMCRNRHLVSYENHAGFHAKFAGYAAPWHEMIFVEKWADAKVERPWNLVLLDLTPGEERKDLLFRLKDWADYIVLHDTELRQDRHYHIRQHLGAFKYCLNYQAWEPWTSVLSDKHELC